jgi:hypothetical protein
MSCGICANPAFAADRKWAKSTLFAAQSGTQSDAIGPLSGGDIGRLDTSKYSVFVDGQRALRRLLASRWRIGSDLVVFG